MHYAEKTPVEWKIQMKIARSTLTGKPLKADLHHNCIPRFSLCLKILTYRHSLAQSHAVSLSPTDTHAYSFFVLLSFSLALFRVRSLSHTHTACAKVETNVVSLRAKSSRTTGNLELLPSPIFTKSSRAVCPANIPSTHMYAYESWLSISILELLLVARFLLNCSCQSIKLLPINRFAQTQVAPAQLK